MFGSGSFRYLAPDAMITVRAGTRSPLSISIVYALIAQDSGTAANQYRRVLNRKLEVIENFLNVGIVIRIDRHIWMCVARQKFLDAHRVRQVIRSDEQNIAQSSGNETCSAEDKCA